MLLPHVSIRRTRLKVAVAAASLVAAASGAVLAAAPASAATDPFALLRQCESSGRYNINTGNGYYGAYQFDLSTWRGLGYSGLPSNAAPAVQDAAAHKLYSERGWSPWPACSRKLDLSSYVVS